MSGIGAPPPGGEGRRAFLALGANLGHPLATFRGAAAALADGGVGDLRAAGVYRSQPEDGSAQPAYLNTVVEGRAVLSPEELSGLIHDVEAAAGRRRSRRNAPRVLDIDLIFFGELVCSTATLTVPHPRWARRPFVVLPLLELDPNWVDPVSRRTVREVASERRWTRATLERVAGPESVLPAGAG